MANLVAELANLTVTRAPITASLRFSLGSDLAVYETQATEAHDLTGAIVYAGYCFLGSLRHVGATKQAVANATTIWTGKTATVNGNNVNYTSDAVGQLPDDDDANFFRMVIAARVNVIGYTFDLVAANQVKEIKAQNIRSYFASKSNMKVDAARIKKYVDIASSLLSPIMSTDDLRAKVEDSDWIRYHTSATSTPALVDKAIQIIDGRLPGFIGRDALDRLENARNAPWSKTLADAIPQKLVAFSVILLQEYGRMPDDTYQGPKALENLENRIITAYRAIAKELKKHEVAATTYQNTTSVQDLVRRITLDDAILTVAERNALIGGQNQAAPQAQAAQQAGAGAAAQAQAQPQAVVGAPNQNQPGRLRGWINWVTGW